ncbi:MAG TPA: hypothetical protein VFQ45_10725 [Longimicrobium sp.]|nr:hypothetical protein [Longimicrobium sp.]
MPQESRSGDSELHEVLTATLNAMDRLLNLFRLERMIHLVVGIVAFLMLLGAAATWLMSGMSDAKMLLIFGSSGLVTISAARITYFFNKAFSLVEDIVRALIPAARKVDDAKP